MATTGLSEMIIPFGKYKGEDVTKLFEDQKYLKWCQDQPWFKEKYSNIYNIVVNQTIVNTNVGDKTPEHNKIQNLFLDNDLCMKLRSIFDKRLQKDESGQYYYSYTAYHVCDDCILCDNHKRIRKHKEEDFNKICQDDHTNIHECKDCSQCNECKITQHKTYPKPHVEFEGNFNWDIIIDRSMLIEVKPTLGDDYPNVLRQMKHQMKLMTKTKFSYETDYRSDYFTSVLLLNNFDSVITSKENLKKIFRQSKIYVVFLNELGVNLKQYISIEDENKMLKQYLTSMNIDYKQILIQS